jgi:hypothetical protein
MHCLILYQAGLAQIIHHLFIFCGGCIAKWPITQQLGALSNCFVQPQSATAAMTEDTPLPFDPPAARKSQ